jgi:hypothetical protein
MIFSEDIIFIHIGKTGGISCSLYLLNHLRGPIHFCHRKADLELDRLHLPRDDIQPHTDCPGGRHSSLAEALNFIQRLDGRTLDDFERVIAVIRDPVALEYSWYKHLQKPDVQQSRMPRARRLATLSFEEFLGQAPHHRPGYSQEAFFLLDGAMPANLHLVRFERLAEEFPYCVAGYLDCSSPPPLPHANRTVYDSTLTDDLTPLALARIKRRHRWLLEQGFYRLDGYA